MAVRKVTAYNDNSIMTHSPAHNGKRFSEVPDHWFVWTWNNNDAWYRKAIFDKKKYLRSAYYVHLFLLMHYINENIEGVTL